MSAPPRARRLRRPRRPPLASCAHAGGSGCHPGAPAVTDKIAERDPADELATAFKLFDDDGTGFISLRNLRRVARDIGESVEDEELLAMIAEFDRARARRARGGCGRAAG